jgi:hypothetical protein
MSLIKIADNSTDAKLKTHLNSMLDKMEKTGTSQDESEWVKFFDEHVYRGYTCLIARIPIKKKQPLILDISTHSGSTYAWQGCAKETVAKNGYCNELKTPKVKDLKTAGQILHKYIDIVRDNGKN